MIVPVVNHGDKNTYEVVNWIDSSDPLSNFIDIVLYEKRTELSDYTYNSSGKDLMKISGKILPETKPTFEICEIKSDSTALIITNCSDYELNEKNEIIFNRRLDALTRDGKGTRNIYQYTYKSNCDLKELSIEILNKKFEGDNIESQANSEIRSKIHNKLKRELDIMKELENIEVESSNCLEFNKLSWLNEFIKDYEDIFLKNLTTLRTNNLLSETLAI